MKPRLLEAGLRFEIWYISIANKTIIHIPARQNICSKMRKNISNQLTQNQYHIMVHTCSICLCWPKLSLIALQFFREIIFLIILSLLFCVLEKITRENNKTSDWNCRTNKVLSRKSSNSFLKTGLLRILIAFIVFTQ